MTSVSRCVTNGFSDSSCNGFCAFTRAKPRLVVGVQCKYAYQPCPGQRKVKVVVPPSPVPPVTLSIVDWGARGGQIPAKGETRPFIRSFVRSFFIYFFPVVFGGRVKRARA